MGASFSWTSRARRSFIGALFDSWPVFAASRVRLPRGRRDRAGARFGWSRVTTRLFRDLTATPSLDAEIDETIYALDEDDEATVVPLKGSQSWEDIVKRVHATSWSGEDVVWILHARSLFCPRVALSVRTNHDFNLYDLPDAYPAVIEVRDGLFQSLECEAFTCRAMAQRTRVRVHGGDRRRFDMLSLCPPVPTRPLRRPTDLSFNATDDSVDTKTAKRYVRLLFEEFATASSSEDGSWSDPLATGRWTPTAGHLLWTLLCLDEDDVIKMHHGLGNEENDPLGQVSKLTTLILMAPWFVTANYLDAVLGRSVPRRRRGRGHPALGHLASQMEEPTLHARLSRPRTPVASISPRVRQRVLR